MGTRGATGELNKAASYTALKAVLYPASSAASHYLLLDVLYEIGEIFSCNTVGS